MIIFTENDVEAMETEEPSGNVAKKKLTLSYEEYKTLSNMLVTYMRKEEKDGKNVYLI
jgi:DNA replication licensing factor MCM6